MRALIAWSSGKDSAYALHVARQSDIKIVGALTTVTETFDRVSMHGVRRDILMAQLGAASLPATIVSIPYPCTNEIYEARMAETLTAARRQGITHMVFGDLFLADVRAYREEKLVGTGIAPLFPLWGLPTEILARDMLASGVETYLATVDLKKLPASFAGRKFDAQLLADFPPGIDPCGERGEFHTCVAAGPMLSGRLAIEVGETVERDGFAYADLRLRASEPSPTSS